MIAPGPDATLPLAWDPGVNSAPEPGVEFAEIGADAPSAPPAIGPRAQEILEVLNRLFDHHSGGGTPPP